MKNYLFILAFMLMTSFSFANVANENKEDYEKSTIETTMQINDEGILTCYVRVCWNETETSRKCTEWQEVPCDKELELEGGSN
jgi:hypothetical protein